MSKIFGLDRKFPTGLNSEYALSDYEYTVILAIVILYFVRTFGLHYVKKFIEGLQRRQKYEFYRFHEDITDMASGILTEIEDLLSIGIPEEADTLINFSDHLRKELLDVLSANGEIKRLIQEEFEREDVRDVIEDEFYRYEPNLTMTI